MGNCRLIFWDTFDPSRCFWDYTVSMSESTPIYLIGSLRLETALTQMGLGVFRTKVSEVAQISAHVRLVILDGDDLGDFQTLATIQALQDCKPYLDVVVFKPDADASDVHTIFEKWRNGCGV